MFQAQIPSRVAGAVQWLRSRLADPGRTGSRPRQHWLLSSLGFCFFTALLAALIGRLEPIPFLRDGEAGAQGGTGSSARRSRVWTAGGEHSFIRTFAPRGWKA